MFGLPGHGGTLSKDKSMNSKPPFKKLAIAALFVGLTWGVQAQETSPPTAPATCWDNLVADVALANHRYHTRNDNISLRMEAERAIQQGIIDEAKNRIENLLVFTRNSEAAIKYWQNLIANPPSPIGDPLDWAAYWASTADFYLSKIADEQAKIERYSTERLELEDEIDDARNELVSIGGRERELRKKT